MSKGSRRRPCLVSATEEDLRWKLFLGKIDKKTFDIEMSMLYILDRRRKR
jgi:hypothetical protein